MAEFENADPKTDFPVKYSLAPASARGQVLDINGITEVQPNFMPRGIMILKQWMSGTDSLLMRFGEQTDWFELGAEAAAALSVGGIYPFGLAGFKSSDTNETNFQILALE